MAAALRFWAVEKTVRLGGHRATHESAREAMTGSEGMPRTASHREVRHERLYALRFAEAVS